MFRSYLRLLLFAFGLLVGVQVPGFIEAYERHVDARRQEVALTLQNYQQTARQFFAGDLYALIEHYRASDDPVFQSDARSVQSVVMRYTLLEQEWRALQGPWYARAWHLLMRADRDLLQATWAGYGFQVLLAPAAIAWGLACALILAWLLEALGLLLAWPLRRKRPVRRRHAPSVPRRPAE